MMEELHSGQSPLPESDELEVAFEKLIAARTSGETPRWSAGEAGSTAGDTEIPCPPPEEWLRLGTGEMDNATAEPFLSHAALCPGCGQRLRLSLQVQEERISQEEAAEIGNLGSASIEWQSRLAKRLARTPRHGARLGKRIYLWVGSGVAASLLLAAFLVAWWQRANSPARLLAEAYSQSRIFDLRMPGARYNAIVPATHLRGGSVGREPAPLLDARARIERNLELAPTDPYWLQLQARADLLGEKFDPAIDILDRLLAAGPVTPALLADDAAAYFERGQATGSENDRATALDYLRRADELAPDDPIVLFNEAVVMEDRGQVMNAVETWNRYLRFERDARWLAEGRARLAALEQKLDRMKTHESRMEQHLATPQAMRALAADPAALAAVDEELSSTLLPRMLYSAFPAPADRSRGSPCDDSCQAARILLRSLANSLESNHRDPWLSRLIPSDSSPPTLRFTQAARALAEAIEADVRGDFTLALNSATRAQRLFRAAGNAAGEDRAAIERIYALQRNFHLDPCATAAKALLRRDPQFAWIHIQAGLEDGICDSGPGTATEYPPEIVAVLRQAQDHRYTLLELRARNMNSGAAYESGDAEDAWRIGLATVRKFYAGDYPPFRVFTTIAGLAQLEKSTPRVQLAFLLERESEAILEFTRSRELILPEEFALAAAAVRAGDAAEAHSVMRRAESEMANGERKQLKGFLAEDEIAMANFYLGRGAIKSAKEELDAAGTCLIGDDDYVHRRSYAAVRGQLELALGHPEAAESLLRSAILHEERQAANAGAGNVIFAQQDRDLYAALVAVWLAEKRAPEQTLALWERYRLRILGQPVPACPQDGLDCLQSELTKALQRIGGQTLMGQIVLENRVLLYRAGAHGIEWSSLPIGKDNVLAAAASLERVAGSPESSLEAVDQAAQKIGQLFFDGADNLSRSDGGLLLESDPALGNLPWAAVETAGGPIGLRFNLEDCPSILLAPRHDSLSRAEGNPLVVGASIAAGDDVPLPEVPHEARDVARHLQNPEMLLAGSATQSNVVAALDAAPAIHFAGHAVQRAGATRLLLAGDPATGKPYLDGDLLRKHPPRAARLIVFSACSSGKREEGWNHGMGDIVNTLAALGVPEVVATRWQIDSASAVPMMDTFYDGLARGFTVPQSLTLARQSLIRDPRYRHPYYWAAYYASGTGITELSEVFHGKGSR
jgi:tetratricopeptide (TPR) repeat protein